METETKNVGVEFFLPEPGRFIQRPSAEEKMWRDGGSVTIEGEMGRKAVGDASGRLVVRVGGQRGSGQG